MHLPLPLLMIAPLLVSAQEQPAGQGRGVNFYSKEKEAALGAALAKEVRRETKEIANAAVREYVERLGRQLVAQLPEATFTYTFEVTSDDASGSDLKEPLALPGGYIFVPSGLLLAAASEAEFAGMLAHAIAHVAERHGTRTATRAQLVNVSSVPLIFMGGWVSTAAEATLPLAFLQFARLFELQADRVGARLMAGAGHDPSALVSYIERRQVDRTGEARVWSALPVKQRRIDTLRKVLDELPERQYSSGDEFQRIQEEVRKIEAKPAPSLRSQ
jgi:predicted Zn-dependent protease